MPGKKQKDWRPFEEARKYARSLCLQTRYEWMSFIDRRYSELGRKPADIPDNPAEIYKFDWQGWADWLGSSSIPFRKNKAPEKTDQRNNQRQKKSRAFAKVRKIADSEEYQRQLITHDDLCSFEEARKYARKLGLESHYEWTRFVCKHLNTMPSKIPLNPAAIYRFEWKGWNDWLGTA